VPSLGGCAHMRAAMYYIFVWMLVSSIPHDDGAYNVYPMAAIFRYCFVYYVCTIIASVNFQEIKDILLFTIFGRNYRRMV